MKKLEFKKMVLKAAKAAHQSVIDDYRNRIRELQSSEMIVNDGQFDSQQQSYNEEVNARINLLADELNFALAELDQLNTIRIEDPLHEQVSFGSVVLTDKLDFFVSVSVEKFVADGHKMFGISTKSPIYQEMKGRRTGDSFAFKGNAYVIKDVY